LDEVSAAISWTEKANNLKNRGFYVDLKNQNWYSPIEITKEQFELERKFSDILLDLVQYLEIILDTPSIEQFLKNTPTK